MSSLSRLPSDQRVSAEFADSVSAASSLPLDEILDEKAKLDKQTGYKMPMVYQVYSQPERQKTEKLVKEAVEGGCR